MAASFSKEGGTSLTSILEWLPWDVASTDHCSPGEGPPDSVIMKIIKVKQSLTLWSKLTPGSRLAAGEMCGPGLGELISSQGADLRPNKGAQELVGELHRQPRGTVTGMATPRVPRTREEAAEPGRAEAGSRKPDGERARLCSARTPTPAILSSALSSSPWGTLICDHGGTEEQNLQERELGKGSIHSALCTEQPAESSYSQPLPPQSDDPNKPGRRLWAWDNGLGQWPGTVSYFFIGRRAVTTATTAGG